MCFVCLMLMSVSVKITLNNVLNRKLTMTVLQMIFFYIGIKIAFQFLKLTITENTSN